MEFPNPFNLASYFLDHNLESRGDKTAVLYRDQAWTYRQLYHAACRFANAACSLGVRQEDRVLTILPDCPAFVVAIMGIHKLGAVLTMVNPRLPTEDLEYYFHYTKAPLAVIDASVADAVAGMRSRLRFLREALVVETADPRNVEAGAATKRPAARHGGQAVGRLRDEATKGCWSVCR